MEKVLNNLKMQVKEELEKIVEKKDMTPTELKNAKDAVCLLKEIQEVEKGMMSDIDIPYDDSQSNRRGRNPMNGQYVSHNYGMRNYDIGYSGHSINDRMIAKLESMADEAKTDYERDEVHRMINMIRMGN